MTFRVMSFNVRGSFHDDGDNDWGKREALNIRTIQKYDPDIIGFQEAQEGNLEAYETHLSDYDVELGFLSIRKAENYHRVPIYWKRECFSKVDAGGYYLSDTPEQFTPGWGAKFPRAVTWVRLRDTASLVEFIVVNTHFPHEEGKDDTRLKCAELIISQLREQMPDIPQILMADFNSLPDSPAYNAFEQAGYTDSYIVSPYDTDLNTFHNFQGDDFQAEGLRIDWILSYDSQNRLKATDCRVIRDAEPPIHTSDHYPILVEMNIS